MQPILTFLITKSKAFRSLRFRFFVLMMIVGLIPCFIMRKTILINYYDRAVSERTQGAMNQCRILANHLEAAGYLQNPDNETINSELGQFSSIYAGRIMIIDGDFLVVKDTYAMSAGKTIVSREIIECARTGTGNSHYDSRNGYIEVSIPIIESISGRTIGVMFASISTDNIEDSLSIFSRKSSIIWVITMVCIVLLSIWLSGYLVRPFARVTETIESADMGEYAVSIPDYTETEAIMDAFNKLMARLKKLDDTRSEFVSNVSHELKTPLASMKVLADSIRSADNVDSDTYKEFMNGIAEEVDRLNIVITDLLSLVKMEKSAGSLNIQPTELKAMIDVIIKRVRPLAEEAGISIEFEDKKDIIADIDDTKISLAIMNLVENAVKYNKKNGKVRIELDSDHQFFTVSVADTGIGIPEDSLDQIFERFYRVDKSHSSEIGGTGLGLSIARNAILLHRGSIKVTSTKDEGTVFVVRIPLKYVA
ncbi:MAG: ATP-binding protein [Lachnospiraceae bacterium]|nr:ATP-binding protein [Lachnospiraceae bacterium]